MTERHAMPPFVRIETANGKSTLVSKAEIKHALGRGGIRAERPGFVEIALDHPELKKNFGDNYAEALAPLVIRKTGIKEFAGELYEAIEIEDVDAKRRVGK